MPVFLFALSQSEIINIAKSLVLFLILHLLVYPSSNGYNSYMDRDEGSIGGIKNPPKTPKALFGVSVFMDIIAILITAIWIDLKIAALVTAYVLISRAYSFRGIRLKKYPIAGFLTVAIFQGAIIYIMVYLTNAPTYELSSNLIYGSLISFFLMGSGYPLTQIYQHKQDKADGVKTISMILGIKGTFLFSGISFFILGLAMCLHLLIHKQNLNEAVLFLLILSPVVLFFTSWMKKTFNNKAHANFENTMKMNKIGAWSMNLFFTLLLINSIYHFV